jgi:hypothetical protein
VEFPLTKHRSIAWPPSMVAVSGLSGNQVTAYFCTYKMNF